MNEQEAMQNNKYLFDAEIQPLIDRVYELCANNGISLLCTCVYARNEADTEDGQNIIVDFDGYTVATGKLKMMPEQMIALAGLLNPELLKHVSEKATETILELHELYEKGELNADTELTDEQQENLRMAETFAHYVDALKLAGPIPFRRTKNGYQFLETLTENNDSVKKVAEEPDEKEMDDELANILRGIIDDLK